MGSPLIDFGASQVPQGQPQSVDPSSQYIGQNGLAPTYQPGSNVDSSFAAPQTPSSPTKTGLREVLGRMLGNLFTGGIPGVAYPGDLMQESLQKRQNAIALQNVQIAHGKAQTQLTQEQADKVPVDLGNGQTAYLPSSVAAGLFKQTLANQGKTDAASINANPKFLKEGYRLNPQGQPEAIPQNELSPVQQQSMKAQQAVADYNDAKAALTQAGNDPTSPIFQQRQKEFQAKLAVLQSTLGLRQQSLGLQQQGQDLKQQEFNQKLGELTPAAQTVMMQTQPARQQIQDLKAKFEAMKDDNTPAKFLPERAAYAAGIQSDVGSAGDAIAQLELNKVAAASRVLKGGSRSYRALQLAMQHTPNVWIDSPKMIYGKLDMLDKALGQVEDSAQQYGRKGSNVAAPASTKPADPLGIR